MEIISISEENITDFIPVLGEDLSEEMKRGIPGLFLVRRMPSGILIPAFLSAYGPECKKDLLHMIRYSIQQALDAYSPETKVMIYRRNAYIRALTDFILPNRTSGEIFFGIRNEQIRQF